MDLIVDQVFDVVTSEDTKKFVKEVERVLTSEGAQKLYGAVEKLLTVDSVDLLSAENRDELFKKLTTRANTKRVREHENNEKEKVKDEEKDKK